MSASHSAIVTVLGAAAAACSMGSFIPQAIKIIREKDASSVSLPMYVITVIGFGLWAAYGLGLRSWPPVASNLVSMSLSALILVLKLRTLPADA
jgi:MtN3 and saliva related transmembrane protein